MKEIGGEPTDELKATSKALKETIDAPERAMRFLNASAHAILLLSIINLLREGVEKQAGPETFGRISSTPRSKNISVLTRSRATCTLTQDSGVRPLPNTILPLSMS